jgi:hypothetical protein
MVFEVSTAVEPDYVRITATGSFTLDRVLAFIDQVKIEADKVARKHILIDTREVEGNMSDADRFFAADTWRIVWLETEDGSSSPCTQITKLGESVAVNRGAQVLVTDCEEEALSWLLGD